jgi:hypothetical protein
MVTQEAAPQLVTTFFKKAAESWGQIAKRLRASFAEYDDAALQTECPATKFILGYMRDLKEFHDAFGALFHRKKRPPAADEFTAAVAMSLEQFLAARGFPGSVRSEETTHRRRGATRPDVSIRANSNKLVATVECKTNLGWARQQWKAQCERRAQALQEMFPGCTPFLCVSTEVNWDASEFKSSPCFGKQWFCLSQVGIGRITGPVRRQHILTPIEPMFLGILQLLEEEKRLA